MIYYYPTYLAHHGIRGMKWGIRRYQNPDGTLTEAGKARYGVDTVDDYYQKRSAEKQEHGAYLRETGNSTAMQIVKGAIGAKVIKKVFDAAGQVAATAIIGATKDGSSTRNKLIAAAWTSVKIGRAAAHAINMGYRLKNISDIHYSKQKDRDAFIDKAKNKILGR